MFHAWRPVFLLVVLAYAIIAIRHVYGAGWMRAFSAASALLLVLGATSFLVYRTVQFLVVFAVT